MRSMRLLDIYSRARVRNGEADQIDIEHGTAAWSSQHIRMRLESDVEHSYRIVSISDGPQLRECRAAQAKIRGAR